ncbi:MAG: Holliday junction branch migration protein RuvA [Acidimicrobiaceae bacterium]|jgi:Holliday junction DNA helicase RuvA|nr:Holliday junction branch migration protein RuvA [Acidimicrobiaceae bacterium]HAY51337.1 Holliday junction branch migration protein RuvA [Acidimicrobiaceae bacterium]|tara:strand:+ start:1795 stop:2403 length:609 start_codon:yes stop_codon:yes gene_type:complete
MTIGSIRGQLSLVEDQEIIVEVGGVGYRIFIPPMTQKQFGETGCETLVYTHHHFREDTQSLYGFPTREECLFFEALISTHGVGPSLGLSILSTHSPNQLANILADEDSDALCLVPGIGKKTASRLLVELQSKIDLDSIPLNGTHSDSDESLTEDSSRRDVRDALSGLGYGREEIQLAMKNLPSNAEPSLLLKLALQELATVT